MASSIFFKTGPNRGLVRDPDVRKRVVARIGKHLSGRELPDQPADDLGLIETSEGRMRLIVRHAVDLVLVTGRDAGHVVLIKRKFPPGAGKWAITGGLIDAGETPRQAALREAKEEAGLLDETFANSTLASAESDLDNLTASLVQLSGWQTLRPFDIRGTAWLTAPTELGHGVTMSPGDLMAVTTVPFAISLPKLRKTALQAGDDAGAVAVMEIAKLSGNMIAVQDHLGFIKAAQRAFATSGRSKLAKSEAVPPKAQRTRKPDQK